MKELKKIIENATYTALKIDGYSQVIIKDKNGNYSFSRKYKGCCPEWYGKIIGCVAVFWEDGILKSRYFENAII